MPSRRPLRSSPKRSHALFSSLRRNRYFWLASGLFGGVLVAGILALVLNYVIQPLSTPETWGYETVETADFHVWFAEESPSLENRGEIIAELDAEFADLLELLQVERSDLVLPIDVFIHDSMPAMQMSIARRKSRSASTYYYSVLDIPAGDAVRPWLVEALLSQGWGQCYSQAIYLGTLLYLGSPNPNYLSTVAAAPLELRHSLDNLLSSEDEARYPATAYQLFGDPSSVRALLSLEDWHTLWFVSDNVASARAADFPRTEIASLIQFLLEDSGGIEILKQAWGPGTAWALLDRCWPAGPEDLAAAWVSRLKDPALEQDASEEIRANLLFEAGHLQAAAAIIGTWDPSDCRTEEQILLATRCCLATGDFDRAEAWAAAIDGQTGQSIRSMLDAHEGWRAEPFDEMTVFAPPSMSRDEIRETILTPFLALCTRIDSTFPDGLLPTVFVHADASSERLVSECLGFDRDLTPIAHVCPGEDWPYEIAHALLPRLWGAGPFSPLARIGTAAFLAHPIEVLVEHGTELSCGTGWVPLMLLDVGTAKESVVRTEAGLLFAQIERTMGMDAVRRAWCESGTAGCVTLESILRTILGTSKADIESSLRTEVLRCSSDSPPDTEA